MSQSCPLCGKTKPGEALFCDDCVRKIQKEYEVDLPEEISGGDLPVSEKLSEEKEPFFEAKIEQESIQESETELELYFATETEEELQIPVTKKKRVGAPFLFLLVITLIGGFLIYNEIIHKSNQDRREWNEAVKTNTVEGYLAYMEAHPKGTHFDEAEAGLHRLKSGEVAAWERMKETSSITELRDFLEQHAESPYAPLVETKLDSLLWIGALQKNTMDSYSNYIALAEKGSIGGDYIAEAQKRYELLSMTQPIDSIALDSIIETNLSSRIP